MKFFEKFSPRRMAGFGLAMMIGAILQPVASRGEGSSSGTAYVVHLKGEARFSADNQTWQPVKKGTVLRAGVLIQTAENSVLDVRLGEGKSDSASGDPAEGVVRLQANTVLAIERLGGEATNTDGAQDVGLDLRAGEISGRVETLPPGSRYEVKFPKGIVGVTGGAYQVTHGVVTVPTGKVVVVFIGADGMPATKLVTTGQQLNIGTGLVTAMPQTPTNEPPPYHPQPAPNSGAVTNSPFNPQRGQGMGGALRRF